MCGIIGYVGGRSASQILLQGLKKLEYRGYDSAGAATICKNSLEIIKDIGRVDEIHKKHDLLKLQGKIGIGHCLHPNTMIQLSNGRITKIKRLNPYGNVLSINSDLKITNKYTHGFKHSSPPQLLEIRVPFTYLRCTDQHRMFVFENWVIKEKTAENLKKGDLLLITKYINFEGQPHIFKPLIIKRYYKLSENGRKIIETRLKELGLSKVSAARKCGIKDYYLEHIFNPSRAIREDVLEAIENSLSINLKCHAKAVDSRFGNLINLPKETTPELMQFIGYLLGDGTIKERCIRFKDSSKDVIVKYEKLLFKIFGLKGKVVKLKDANAWMLEVNSLALCNWLRENVTSLEDGFPDFIGTLPKSQVASFLCGIFDAEGCVGKKSKQIKIGMTNMALIQTIQLLLLRFQIISGFREEAKQKGWNTCFVLTISYHDCIESFAKEIGFTDSQKMAETIRLLSKMQEKLNFSTKFVPLKKSEILSSTKIHGKARRLLKGKGYITKFTAKRLVEELEKSKQSSEIISTLKMFLGSDIAFQEIISIKQIQPDTIFVYDLEVSGSENFIANGLISHNSRWATHGGVTKENAHPHLSNNGKIAVVHNGIIENFQQEKEFLKSQGFVFHSDTDTEVIPNNIEYHMKKGYDFIEAAKRSLKHLEGQYAIVALNDEGKMVAVRKEAPLVIGIGNGEYFIASDVTAFLEHTKDAIFLEENDMVTFDGGLKIFNLDKNAFVERPISKIEWDAEQAKKGNFDHFFIKEVIEQADVIERIAKLDMKIIKEIAGEIKKANGIYIVACGTAAYACLQGLYLFSKIAKTHINFCLASEFQHFKHFLTDKSLIIAISQSGETADTLEAIRVAKSMGAKVISITNVMGSTLLRESDKFVLQKAGPEICVLSTKSYTSQLAVLALLAYELSGRLEEGIEGLKELSRYIYYLTSENARKFVKALAEKLKDNEHLYLIGRGLQYPTALEAALKIKEVSYIHAEAFAGGELKHGNIALIERGTPCIVFTSEETEKEAISNACELKARGAYIIGVGPKNNDVFDFFIKVREAGELNSICQIIPIQILAYQLALLRGCNPDMPRNLAKSVTVK